MAVRVRMISSQRSTQRSTRCARDADAVEIEIHRGSFAKEESPKSGTPGGAAGDAQVDTVVVNGTSGIDRIRIGRKRGDVVVAGLRASVRMAHPEVTDTLVVNGLGEVDRIKANPSLSLLVTLVINPD